MDDVFNDSTRVLCTKHLRDNFNDYMQSKCGIKKSIRTRLIDEIFSDDNGLINADDSVVFHDTAVAMTADSVALSNELGRHFSKHVEPALRQYVFEPRQQNPWITRLWTNNASESANHILKLAIDWRPRRLPELVDRPHSVVNLQQSKVRRAVHGSGNYKLAEQYKKFSVELQSWQTISSSEKDAHVVSFQAFKPEAANKIST